VSQAHRDARLAQEALAARVDALLGLDRRAEALGLLEKHSFDRLPRGGELRVLRAELRAAKGRCGDALRDFSGVTETHTQGDVAERALYGQALCQAQVGDTQGAMSSLQHHLARFPSGRFATQAQTALQKLGAFDKATATTTAPAPANANANANANGR